MSSALVNDIILWFLLLLVVLLILMLAAAIRVPPVTHSLAEGDQPAAAEPTPLANGRAAARPTGAQAAVASGLSLVVGGQSGKTKYEPKHDGGPRFTRGMVRTASSPPWGPAPRPPDLHR